MAFDYPSSPVLNQVYTAPTGQGYVWSGTAWNLSQSSPQAPVASDNPPANPYAGQLWLRSTTGALYCWYADPTSSQWIQIPGMAAPGGQPGFIYGATLSNNGADAANGIDISPGTVASDDPTGPVLMILASVLTKKVNTNWAVGSGSGGLDTGAVSATANYHVWLIQRSDTGVVDALFSLSGTAPAMPASYDRKRRLGLVIRNTSAILAFRQFNRRFMLGALSQVRSNVAAASNIQLLFLNTAGVRVRPIFNSALNVAASSSASNQFADGDAATTAATFNIATYGTAAGQDVSICDGVFVTDTAGNLRFTATAAGTVSGNAVSMFGWYDDVWV